MKKKLLPIEIVWIVLAVLCGLYGLAVRLVGSGADFYIVWLHGAGFFLVLFLAARFGLWDKMHKILKGIWIAIVAIFMCLFVFVEGLIIKEFACAPAKDLDYIIVLGSMVYKSGPSDELRYRLDAAYDYLVDNENTKCVVSGGQGEDEPFPEGIVMAEYLIGRGIDSNRVLVEDKSENTKQNIAFSKRMICDDMNVPNWSDDVKVGIVSSHYHLCRAKGMAKKQGVINPQGIPSKSSPFFFINNMAREFVGVCKYTILGDM